MSAFCNAPICERCWIARNSEMRDGHMHIQQPVRLLDPEAEQCAWCGDPTIFGAYCRAKRTDVPYPPREDDD